MPVKPPQPLGHFKLSETQAGPCVVPSGRQMKTHHHNSLRVRSVLLPLALATFAQSTGYIIMVVANLKCRGMVDGQLKAAFFTKPSGGCDFLFFSFLTRFQSSAKMDSDTF